MVVAMTVVATVVLVVAVAPASVVYLALVPTVVVAVVAKVVVAMPPVLKVFKVAANLVAVARKRVVLSRAQKAVSTPGHKVAQSSAMTADSRSALHHVKMPVSIRALQTEAIVADVLKIGRHVQKAVPMARLREVVTTDALRLPGAPHAVKSNV
jgi:hypothetical protein